MIRIFKILQNFKDIFKKKKIIFFKNFGGAQAPLGHQVALPLIYSIKENDMVKFKLRKKTLHREYNLNSTKQYIL